MPRYSALIFDFGGTLADIHPRHEWLYVRACSEFGITLDPSRAGITDDFGWEAFQTPDGPVHEEMSTSAEAFARHKTAILVDRLQRMGVTGPLRDVAARVLALDTEPEMYRVFDDVLPVLQRLRSDGCRMAILSNHEWRLPELIEGLGLGPYFDAVVTSARVGYRKPHPRMFETALKALEAEAAITLVVGDSLASDVEGARRMGMDAVLVDRHGRYPSLQQVPVVSDLTGLSQFL